MVLRFYLSIALFFGYLISSLAQVQYVPMVELFTNASCSRCEREQRNFDEILAPFRDRIVSMEYHYTPDDEIDVLAEQESVIPLRRKNFYEQKIQRIPAMVIGGMKWPGRMGAPRDLTADMIEELLAKPTQLSLEINHHLNLNHDSVFVTINLTNASQETFMGKDIFVYVALIEKEILFNEPIGSNDQLLFNNVVRKMIPSYIGKKLGRNLLKGRNVEVSLESSVPDYIYDLNQLAVVAWVQHTKTKEIFQSGESAPIDLTPTKNIAELINFEVSPNPVSDILNIKLEGRSIQPFKIVLTDLHGREVGKIWEGSTRSTQIEWPVTGLYSGLYIVKVETPTGIYSRKVQVFQD